MSAQAWRCVSALVTSCIFVACGGDGFTSSPTDAGATLPDGEPAADTAIAVDVDGSSTPTADVDAAIAADAGDVTGHDASSDKEAGTCTPIAAYTEPATCACFFAGSCPILRDGGRSPDCLWAETPLTVTGQPTCRGCGLLAFPTNPCNRCKETFSCACLAPYLDPGQRCCDGPGGPYLSDYACP